MAHFPDLSPYSYDHRKELDPNVLNVGWLSGDSDFVRGKVPEAFTSALFHLAESPINLYRGSHSCELCADPVIWKAEGARFSLTRIPGSGGNGEIHVPGLDGITYVAPALIAHYVKVHQYLPPQEFIDTVLRLG